MTQDTLSKEKPFVFDADSHWSEPADLFTSRAPAKWKDRVPHVEVIDGERLWIFDGQQVGRAVAGAVVGADRQKSASSHVLETWTYEQAHPGAYDPKARIEVNDEFGIDHQLIFPSTIGLGGQGIGLITDEPLRRGAIEIYNDGMAEIQEQSGNRLMPLPLMPAWDVDACVYEAKRVAGLGARGVNMTSDPQDLGAPDLANRAWDPFWEVCVENQLPVHFHIGASITNMTFFGKYPWDSHPKDIKLGIGGTLLFIGNARVVVNAIMSGVFDRHPDLQMVSVESGAGWIPFILETLDYEMSENARAELKKMKKMPSEYFKTNWYATFWFEKHFGKLPELIDMVGEDRILFATDFPHPTCLYPNPVQDIEPRLESLRPEVRTKILGENAKKLYRV